MKCEDALLLISGHIDGENTPEEEQALQAHLCSCAECRGVLQAFQEADGALAEQREPAPKDLCAGVMAQIKQETTKRKRRPWYGIAIAAALTLVIGVSAVMDLPEEEYDLQTVSNAESYTVSRSISGADTAPLAQTLAEDRGAAVVVVSELYYEIETYPCQTIEEGHLLYTLPGYDLAAELAENHGCELYEPLGTSDQTVSYALLIP